MSTSELSELNIEVVSPEASEEDIDRMTRQLLSEIREMPVEWAELARGGAAPEGTKSIDPVTTGAIVMAAVQTVLPRVIDGVQAWVLRGSNRSVKFKGKIAGQPVEFEGSAEDLQKLIASLDKTKHRQ